MSSVIRVIVSAVAMDDERIDGASEESRADYFSDVLERIRVLRTREHEVPECIQDILPLAVDHNARLEPFRRNASFRVVHVFMLNRHHDLLLQQLSRNHTRHPLWWGASVAGHVRADELSGDAAARKLNAELGITKRPKLVGKTEMLEGQSRKTVAVYALRWDGPISPNPADFAAIQFCSLQQVLSKPETLKLRLTPTFMHIVQRLREPLQELVESSALPLTPP